MRRRSRRRGNSAPSITIKVHSRVHIFSRCPGTTDQSDLILRYLRSIDWLWCISSFRNDSTSPEDSSDVAFHQTSSSELCLCLPRSWSSVLVSLLNRTRAVSMVCTQHLHGSRESIPLSTLGTNHVGSHWLRLSPFTSIRPGSCLCDTLA